MIYVYYLYPLPTFIIIIIITTLFNFIIITLLFLFLLLLLFYMCVLYIYKEYVFVIRLKRWATTNLVHTLVCSFPPGTRYTCLAWKSRHHLQTELRSREGHQLFLLYIYMSVSTIAPPHASDGFKTDSTPFLPHSFCCCWSDLFMWIAL